MKRLIQLFILLSGLYAAVKFLRQRIAPPERIVIFYDDRCRLCQQGYRWLQALNWDGRYRLLPMSQSRDILKDLNISEEEAQASMCGVYRGEVFQGYELYLLIARENPLLAGLFPMLWLMRFGDAGPRLYRWVAENRYRLFRQQEPAC